MSTVARRLGPATAAIVGAALVWFAADALAWRMVGPSGFEVTTTDGRGAVVAKGVAAQLLTPEVAPTPPVGGSLVARATFLAPTSGTYVWQLGASCLSRLKVDGVVVYTPAPGRVAPREQHLEAGLHAIEIVMPRADGAGAIAFGVRPPWRPWRGALAGRGEVVALPVADVRARLGAHPILVMRLAAAAAPATLVLALALPLAAMGAARRRRVREYVAALAADRDGARFLVAVAFVAMVLPLISPLFQPGFFACGEEESYIVRLGEYERAIRGGVPMGRWWPDPVFGRGYPFLCVYAPLTYLLATPLLLVGVSPLVTVKVLSGALVIVGALAVYRLARRRGSAAAALLAATLFTYAPYLHTNVWIREDLAEALGQACFPLALLALERALDCAARRWTADAAALALALAALGCSHNITAYFSVYFLGAWVVLRMALGTSSRDGLRRTLVGAALGFVLCVFYAVPALFDANRIWIERVMTGYYNPVPHFVSPLAFFVSPPRYDMRLYVGVPATLLVLVAVVMLVSRRPRGEHIASRPPTARTLALLAVVEVALAWLFATRPFGRFLVAHLPLASHVQFPWRLLLFAASTAPLCVPMVLDGLVRPPRLRWLASAAASTLLVVVLAPTYGPPAPLVRSRLDVEKFLRSLEVDYVTSMNEYLPRTVKRTIPRFDEIVHVTSGKARALAPSRAPGRYQAIVDSDEPLTLEFNAHWFVGWKARVDGAPQAIGPGENGFADDGLIRVRVPAGHHDVTLRFERTPLRAVCDAISGLALVLVLVLSASGARRRPRATD